MAKTTRDRGWVENYKPYKKTLERIAEVEAVLETYSAQVPLTIRQIFYVLVTQKKLDKTEKAYNALIETLSAARRARLIPMASIRDDGMAAYRPEVLYSAEHALKTWRDQVERVQCGRQLCQDRELVVWCEAGGMAPMLFDVSEKYGIPVISSGGFDSLTNKYEMAQSLAGKTVLHIGDYDPSGVHMFSALAEDVAAFTDDAEFIRIAVLPEHIDQYSLPTSPPKKTDNRAFNDHRTVQAEAFAPDVLCKLVEDAITSRMDLVVYKRDMDREAEAKEGMRALLRT